MTDDHEQLILDENLEQLINKCRDLREFVLKFRRGGTIPFTDKSLMKITQCKLLKKLEIQMLEFEQEEEKYQEFNLHTHDSITDQFLASLANSSIQELRISNCNITDQGVKNFFENHLEKTLQFISIINCPKVTKISREWIQNVTNVKFFIPIVQTNWYNKSLDNSYYDVKSKKIGICVLINNIEFKKVGLPNREGADIDAQLLKYVFQDLGFEVIDFLNVTKEKMFSELHKIRDQIENNSRENFAFSLIISSHGDIDTIYTTDKNDNCVNVDDVINIFNDKNCPALKAKPKIFILSSCRGGEK
jgi:hypothetical protein